MIREDSKLRRRVPRGTAARLAGAVAVAALLCVPASASAEPTYFVTVDQSGAVGSSPAVTRRVSPRLPDGATLEGGVRCTQVRVPGSGGYTLSRPEDVDPGYYQIDTPSCRENPNFPLRIEGAPGTVQVLGGIDTVRRSRTAVATAGTATDGNREIVLTATVQRLDFGDSPQIPNEKIRFFYQNFDGQMFFGCDSITEPDGNGNAVATCILKGDTATKFLAGTGLWQATYEGTSKFEGSASAGIIPGGQTTFEQAADNYQKFLASGIEIVVRPIPPGCHRVDGSSPNASLLTISLSALDCNQLRALQITTNVVLAVTAVVVVVNAPTGIITEALKQSLYKAAEELVKASPALAVGGF